MAPVILSVREKEGLTAILKKLNTDDLVSLTYTATHGMVKAESRDEAIRVVLTFTEKPAVLLRRRKVKKELIFQYLREEGVVVSVNGEKMDFVKACLQYWKSDASEEANPTIEEPPDEEQCIPVPQPSHNSVVPSQVSSSVSPLQEMGLRFAMWYFHLLNNSAVNHPPEGETFGPHHFWPDCSLKVCVEQQGQVVVSESITRSDNVSDYLYKLVAEQQLFFNPNLNEDGVRCHQEYHGLVRIIAGGVVHKCGNCVGLFDQMFGLVLDPNSVCRWRIKDTKLLLKLSRAISSAQVPALT